MSVLRWLTDDAPGGKLGKVLVLCGVIIVVWILLSLLVALFV